MNEAENKPWAGLAGQTRLARYLAAALLLHLILLIVLASIKVSRTSPQTPVIFESVAIPALLPAREPPPVPGESDYRGATLGGGGGTPGKGAGGDPNAGGTSTHASSDQENLANIVGIMADETMTIPRPAGIPGGTGSASLEGVGDSQPGVIGVKGPGGNIFGARRGPQQTLALYKFKGAEQTEKAVESALQWLKDHQEPDGSWKCGKSAPAGTALAVLAFLGHGETPDSPGFGPALAKGLLYLAQHIDTNGLVTGVSQDYIGYGYSQGPVVLALSEGYALTLSPVLHEPLNRALQAIFHQQAGPKTRAQDAGGWRNQSQAKDSDVAVTGWMVMALKSAQAAGVEIPKDVFEQASRYLWNMYDTKNPGFGYQNPERYPSMTAVGVLSQQFLGNENDPRIKASLDYLKEQKVDWDKSTGDFVLYGWYYMTQAMFQGGGLYWQYWNSQIRDTLVKNQQSDGRWLPPPHSIIENRDLAETPAYSTALGALMLETYYRYQPVSVSTSP